MAMRFTKMHGLGNDFIVIDAINQSVALDKKTIATLADRRRGIGFDQCLVVEASHNRDIDFRYRIYNADGTEVGQCGNGARCLALFLKQYGLTAKRSIRVETLTTTMTLRINDDHSVSVELSPPLFLPKDIPFAAESQQSFYPLKLKDGSSVKINVVNVGNPHAILTVDAIEKAPVDTLGQQISTHPLFPQHVNAGFMQILSSNHLRLRVYERGCGETEACGSGAVAAAVIGRSYFQMSNPVTVSLAGGDLSVSWAAPKESILLTGSATFVYEGKTAAYGL